jgi:hypothetical protein
VQFVMPVSKPPKICDPEICNSRTPRNGIMQIYELCDWAERLSPNQAANGVKHLKRVR